MIIGAHNRAEYLAQRHARLIGAAAVWFALTVFIGPTWAAILTYLGGWLFARPAMFRLHVRYAWVLLAVIVVLAVHHLLVSMVGPRWGMAGTFWTFGFTAVVNRDWLRGQWWEWQRLREWKAACRQRSVGLYERPTPQHPDGRAEPWLLSAKDSPVGLRLRVDTSAFTAADLERAAPALATAYRARQVTVQVDERNASHCTVLVHTRDPLAAIAGKPWPHLPAPALSMWDPIPLGVSELGRPINVRLPEKHLLLTGQSGSGKSVAQSMLVATAALDPTARLYLIDGKDQDLPDWEPAATRYVGASHTDAIAVLTEAIEWMDAVPARLKAEAKGKRKIAPGDPLCVVVVDELAYFTHDAGTKKQQEEFSAKLGDLVRRGRSRGVIVIGATQRASHDLIPTSLRNQFLWRWALSVWDRTDSDMCLGPGMADKGFDASTIPSGQPGVGYLRHEDEVPVRMRTYFLDDPEIVALAERAATVRSAVRVEHAARRADPDRPPESSGPAAKRAGSTDSGAVPGSATEGTAVSSRLPQMPRNPWREPVLRELQADASRSNSQIGRALGCDPNTVRRYRREWESGAA